MPDPIYITEKDVAKFICRGVNWLRDHAEQLERQYGFPKVDPAIGRRHRPSIEEWAAERNSRPLLKIKGREHNQENEDAL